MQFRQDVCTTGHMQVAVLSTIQRWLKQCISLFADTLLGNTAFRQRYWHNDFTNVILLKIKEPYKWLILDNVVKESVKHEGCKDQLSLKHCLGRTAFSLCQACLFSWRLSFRCHFSLDFPETVETSLLIWWISLQWYPIRKKWVVRNLRSIGFRM